MEQIDKILATAATLFEARGYHETSVGDIATAAGLTKGGLYYHITSKEDLLFLIQDDLLDGATAGLKKALARKETATEKLRTLIITYLEQQGANREKIAISFYEEKVKLPEDKAERIRQKRRGYVNLPREVVQQGIESGEFRQDLDPHIVANGILGMCLWSFLWYRPGGRLTPKEIGEIYAEMAISALKR